MFAEEVNIDVSLGSDSGNLVIPNSGRGKERFWDTCAAR